jgi:gliding motility-associated-like protein
VHPRPLPRLPISIDVTKPLTCSGGAGLASLRAVISKGANPYQIEWFGPITYHMLDSVDITNLNYGKYVVNVTDNLGCFRKDSISIVPVTAKAYISADVVPPGNYNVSCIGSSDGTILVAVTGGITPPYQYWVVRNDIDTLFFGTFTDNLNLLDPFTFRYYNNLPAANYTLIIRDKNGCEDRKLMAFRVPPVMVVGFGKSQYQGGFNISCKGYNDGSAWIQTITGGRGSYSYRWYTFNGNIPGPVNTNRIDNITTGKYYLETKDVLNCVKIDSVLIIEPDGMKLSGYELSKSPDGNYTISCNGGNDGYIKLNITGGSGTYINRWTGPNGFTGTTKDISGLLAGTYADTIKDLNGCKLIPVPSFTLSQPTQLNITVVKSLSTDGSYNINCNEGTGSINLTLTGGSIGNYKYNWSTINGSGLINGQEDQNALTAGTYDVMVTDSNRCVISSNNNLIQPQALSLVLNPTHITCQSAGFNNGSVDLTVSGGVGPYLYSWSNGATSEDINGLTQGYYKVTVRDVNGCQKPDSVRINPPPPIAYSDSTSSFNGYNISCYGLSDGLIKITPSGGEAPFIYNWQGPDGFVSSNQNISDLKAGQYNLLITDNNLCKATGTINLTEPGKLDMTITLSASIAGGYNINCAGDSTGTININAVNQVIAANYLWSDGFTGKSRANLPAGVYKIIITDNNNCHADSTINLTEPDSLKLNSEVTQPFCPDSPDGEIRLKVTGGVVNTDYIIKWSSDNSVSQIISNLKWGSYWVNVTDGNGCSHRDTIKLDPQRETCLIIPNAISPNDDNINDIWNIDKIYLYPQIEIKIYNRWGELLWKSERGYPKPWDGRSNGTPLPIDSYHYIIDLHNGTKPIIGNITIVR